MRIYTRTGDDGETGLFGGARVLKCDPRIAAYGDLDELNAQLGFARTLELPLEVEELLCRLQHDLFDLGAELASPNAPNNAAGGLSDDDVAELESVIDRLEAKLTPLRNFILPGGGAAAAALHVARCVSRRAERSLVALAQVAEVRGAVLRYVNRLSDLLFVVARYCNADAEVPDVPWQKKS